MLKCEVWFKQICNAPERGRKAGFCPNPGGRGGEQRNSKRDPRCRRLLLRARAAGLASNFWRRVLRRARLWSVVATYAQRVLSVWSAVAACAQSTLPRAVATCARGRNLVKERWSRVHSRRRSRTISKKIRGKDRSPRFVY